MPIVDLRDIAILNLRTVLQSVHDGRQIDVARVGMVLQQTESVGRLAALRVQTTESTSRSLLEFEGLGADLWKRELAERNAQEYIDQIRGEWDEREATFRKDWPK